MTDYDIFDEFDDFDDEDDVQPTETSATLSFSTNRVSIELGSESQMTLNEAFSLYARQLGTDADAAVQFRSNQTLSGDTVMQPGVEYYASVSQAKHG